MCPSTIIHGLWVSWSCMSWGEQLEKVNPTNWQPYGGLYITQTHLFVDCHSSTFCVLELYPRGAGCPHLCWRIMTGHSVALGIPTELQLHPLISHLVCGHPPLAWPWQRTGLSMSCLWEETRCWGASGSCWWEALSVRLYLAIFWTLAVQAWANLVCLFHRPNLPHVPKKWNHICICHQNQLILNNSWEFQLDYSEWKMDLSLVNSYTWFYCSSS